MKAVLVRIGVDHSYGEWNAPADPASGRFVYVPIPENPNVTFHANCKRSYAEVIPALECFATQRGLDLFGNLTFPPQLTKRAMHLDPDFDQLTYGDVGDRRGSEMKKMKDGDLIAFYAGLRSVDRKAKHLIYALVGLLVVDEVLDAVDVAQERWHENAHTRKTKRGPTDIVARAQPGKSGLFDRFIPIGEYRDRAYRVRRDLLKAWGGLTVNDGYIQRSARPPLFPDPQQFKRWFQEQDVSLLQHNNWSMAERKVILVHLRQPRRHDPNESRDDPFWEFGSFGCTKCHTKNLMNPKRINELNGARLAFAQGGPLGFKLVMLTPPVTVVRHRDRCELRWEPVEMPFRYKTAPRIVDDDGETDFLALLKMLRHVDRST